MNIDEQICYICDYEYNYFLNKKNVVAIGLGYKIIKGTCTNKKCIKVFVKNKLSGKMLNSFNLIPPLYKGILTDVIESGEFSSYSLTKRVRPVTGGYSISYFLSRNIGSIGCVVKNKSGYYVLSCNHVMADVNSVSINTPIIQPATFDNGTIVTDTIATLSNYIRLRSMPYENYVDCAIAKISDDAMVSSAITYFGKPTGISLPYLDQSVKKAGRTTGATYGYITAVNATANINLKNKNFCFKKQIITTNMSDKGDSGALLMDINNKAVGLLIGGTKSISVFNPITIVLKQLNVQLVTN